MGKPNKKLATKVEVAPVVAAPVKSGKKGKREADVVIEKVANAKKQKIEVKTLVKKKKQESSSSDDSSSESEEQKVVTKKVVPAKAPVVESSSEDSSSDDEPVVKAAVATKNGTAAIPAKKGAAVIPAKKATAAIPAKKGKLESSSEESDSSSSDEEPPTKKLPAVALKNKVDSSDSSDDSSSDEEEAPAKAPAAAPAAKKKVESSESDSSSDEEEAPAKKAPAAAAKKKVESSESDSSSDEEEAPAKKVPAPAAKKKVESSESDSSSDEETVKTGKTAVTPKGKVESSDSSDDDSEEDSDEEEKKPVTKTVAAKKATESSSDSSEEESSDEEMTDVKSPKTNIKQAVTPSEKNVPKTPVTTQATGSNTLFVGNLPFSIGQDDVRNFFKDAGEVVDVRFGINEEGQCKGYGHVEFATAEDAQNALKLNGESLWDRPVRLDLARAKGEYTPNSGFQKSGRGQSQTIFVRGFDNSLGEDEVRNSLVEHFSSCGEIAGSTIRLPVDRETNSLKGMAYIEFQDSDTFGKALELNGSEFGEGYLTIEEAKPRPDRRDGGGDSGGRPNWRGGSSGGNRFNDSRGRGRDSGFRGRGRDSGFRGRGGDSGFRGRGGRDGGRGGRGGRGTPYNKPSMVGTGKKTTFDD